MQKDKEITMYDLAKKLNISIATVSRALQDDPVVSKKTKKKIFELAEEMGYRSNHFARNLRQQQANRSSMVTSFLQYRQAIAREDVLLYPSFFFSLRYIRNLESNVTTRN